MSTAQSDIKAQRQAALNRHLEALTEVRDRLSKIYGDMDRSNNACPCCGSGRYHNFGEKRIADVVLGIRSAVHKLIEEGQIKQ